MYNEVLKAAICFLNLIEEVSPGCSENIRYEITDNLPWLPEFICEDSTEGKMKYSLMDGGQSNEI
jgi:hypothetical protein